MANLKSGMVPYLTTDEIEKAVIRLAREIDQQYQDQSVVLLAPLKGSFMFLADLARKLKTSCLFDFVLLGSSEKDGSTTILKDASVNLKNKHVLIVEEIIDSGRKLSFLKSRVHMAEPASLRIVTLLDKPARRELPIKADFIGITVDDRYLVGYGMDSDGKGRNYADIFSFKQ